MKPPVDLDLLKKFARNECTPQELSLIRKYMQQPECRAALEEALDRQWEDFEAPAPDADTVKEWKAAFEQRYAVTITAPAKSRKGMRWLGYAAAACIIPLLFISITRQQKKNKTSTVEVAIRNIQNPKGRIATITLPDSSIIQLGPGSRLQYPSIFSGNTREIVLEGEAFFEVARNPQQPFIVRTGDIYTRVLGTSFKIEALPGQPVLVAVATGRVSVSRSISAKEELLATLTPGKQAGYDPVSGTLVLKDLRPAEIAGWKAGILSFGEAPFAAVIASMERWYDVHISLAEPALGKKKMQLVINGKRPVSEALETISQITGLRYTINGQEIHIY